MEFRYRCYRPIVNYECVCGRDLGTVECVFDESEVQRVTVDTDVGGDVQVLCECGIVVDLSAAQVLITEEDDRITGYVVGDIEDLLVRDLGVCVIHGTADNVDRVRSVCLEHGSAVCWCSGCGVLHLYGVFQWIIDRIPDLSQRVTCDTFYRFLACGYAVDLEPSAERITGVISLRVVIGTGDVVVCSGHSLDKFDIGVIFVGEIEERLILHVDGLHNSVNTDTLTVECHGYEDILRVQDEFDETVSCVNRGCFHIQRVIVDVQCVYGKECACVLGNEEFLSVVYLLSIILIRGEIGTSCVGSDGNGVLEDDGGTSEYGDGIAVTDRIYRDYIT